MNEEILNNIWKHLSSEGLTDSDFETWKANAAASDEVQENIHKYLSGEGLTKSSLEEWREKTGLKKKDGTADSTVVEEVTESVSPPSPELGLSVPSAPDDPELLGAYEDTPVTAPQEGEAVADPNFLAVPREGQSEYDRREEVAVALAEEDDAKDQRSAYDRSLDILDKRQHEQDTKLGLNFKDRDYTDKTISDLEEEEVVGEMRYHFGDYGFKFEEFGLTDNMRVTAPNGVDTIEISLDNWTDKTDEAETKKLKKFMQQHRPIEKTGLDRIESEALGNERKILGKKDYEERLLSMTVKTRDLKDKIKDFTARKIASDKLGKKFSRMGRAELSRNQAAYNQWLAEDAQLKTEGDILEGDIDGMKTKGKQLDSLVGKYMGMRSEEGSFMGGLWNSGWEGFGQIFSAAYGAGVDAVSFLISEKIGGTAADAWAKHAKGLDRGGGEYNEFSQAASGYMSQDRKGIQRLIRERGTAVAQSHGSGVSKEYTDAAGFVEGALYGTASSLPAMAMGLPALVLQGIDMVSKETENNPLFEGVSELEKLSIAAPIGIVMGWLEKVGLTKAIAGTSTLSKMTLGALKKFGVSPTTRTFSEFVDFEVANGGKRALLKFMSSGAAEFETGALQETNDIIMKKIYNELKGQDLFQSPESFGDALLQIGEGAVAEAIGGFALGTPGAVVSGVFKGNLGAISDETFSVFEALMSNSESKTAYIESLKQKIVSGEITKTEGQRQIEEAENIMGVMSQIPTNYTPAQKKKALGLLLRRAKLQGEVDRGDKQLVTKQQTEIDVINEQLQNLETEETTTEVEEATTEEAIEALEAEDAIMEKMTGKPSATLRTPKVIEKKRQELTKQRQDAIQKSGAKSVDVQEQARDGKTMGEGDPLGAPTSESVQETEDVTSEDPAEQAEIDILSSLFGGETTEEGGETTAAVEVGEKVKVETPEGGKVEGQKLSDNVGMIQTPGAKTAKTSLQKGIIKLATNTAKSIAKILPNTKIIIHESVDSFKKLGGRGKGFYNPTSDTIHINLSTATRGTIAHETFHAILSQKLGIDANIQLATKEMLDTVMETITDKKVLERLEKFRLLYERASLESGKKASQLQEKYNQLAEAQEVAPTPEGQAQLDSLLQQIEEATNESTSFEEVLQEEQLAELTAILAEHYAEANSATQNAIVKWLKKLAQTLNLSPVIVDQVFNNKGNKSAQNQAVIDLLNTIARKTVLGEEITETDIETIEQYAEPTDKKVAPETGAKETTTQEEVVEKQDDIKREDAPEKKSKAIRERSKRKQAKIKKSSKESIKLKSRQENKAKLKAAKAPGFHVVGDQVWENTRKKINTDSKVFSFFFKGKEYRVFEFIPSNVNIPKGGYLLLNDKGGAVDPSSIISNYFLHALLKHTGNIGAQAYADQMMLNSSLETTLVPTKPKKGKTKHQLDLSSPDAFIENEIRKPLEGDGTFAHMTAENPGNKTLSAEENAQRNEEVREVLEEKGYEFIEVDGKYNRDEKSFFVKDISVEDAIDIGVQFGQESVSHSAGMLYTTGENAGKMEPTTGEVSTDPKMENFYSTVHTKEGSQKYQVGYDWGNFVDIPKATEQTEIDEIARAEGASVNLGAPTKLNSKTPRGKKFQLTDIEESYPLSFVTKDDIIDINSLIEEIQAKGQKVWFWTADQLGRGEYEDLTIEGSHYLDAGPSYALDPENREKGEVWATGKSDVFINKNSKEADYVFIISGSPVVSKLFNKSVFDAQVSRLGDFKTFKKKALASNPSKAIREVLEAHDSWPSLRRDSSVDTKNKRGTGRKKFLLALLDQQNKRTKFAKLVIKLGGFIDLNELRDGFYRKHDFKQNDIMVVLRPTGAGPKTSHSTYLNTLKGEVVGVPDAKVNAFDIMPKEIRDKYKGKKLSRTQQSQAVAPFGSAVRTVEKGKRHQLDDQGNDISKLELDTKYNKSDIIPDSYINNNKISDPLNPAKLPKKKFSVTWEEQSSWGDLLTQERTFNDGQHFVNFWRKATNDGAWDYLSNFTFHTEPTPIVRKVQRKDGSWTKIEEIQTTTQPIDIEKLKGWNFKNKVSNPQRLKQSRKFEGSRSKAGKTRKFQLDVDGPNASVQEIITEGRGAGLKDSSIGSYLHRIKKVPKKLVKKLLEFDKKLFKNLPKSFAEVEGGLLAGAQLFKDIQAFISKETKANARRTKLSQAELKGRSRAKRKELTKKNVKTSAQMREIKRKIRERIEKRNNFRQNPRPKKEVDAQVNELYEIEKNKNTAAKVAVDKAVTAFEVKQEKANAKKKGKLTSQEIMDLAIERLMAHPLYKKLADTRKSKGKVIVKKDPSTLQAEMVSDLQKTLGVRPTQNMRKALTKLRQMVRFRNQGARQLQLAKRELLRFMRQTLPKTAYTKKEAIDLARRVAQATAKDMTGLMHEVIQLSSKKNVGILSRAISKLLKPYETKQSGRIKGTSIDNITRRVVKGIIAHLNNPKATAADVQSRNTELLERFNVLSNQMETTVEERLEMEGLVVAINLNNAMLMEDTDPNKAIALDRAHAALRGLIEGGRSNLKESLAQEKAAFNEDFAKIYEDITGDKIPVYKEDVLDEEGNVIHEKGEFNFEIIDKEVQKKNLRRRRKETHNRLVQGLRGFVQSVKNFFTYQHQLSGLINKISKLPGELFGGITEEQVVDRIDEGTRRTKELNLMMKRAVEGKMKELWGKKWKFKVGALAKVFKTKVYLDQAAVDKAQKTYDENPTSENKANLRFVKSEQELSMSQNEIYYLYNQFKDPSNHAGFESRFGKDYARIMEELTATLDPETQAFADWQVEEFFPMVYPIYNEIYQKVYKTDMPWNEFYAGPLMREGEVVQDLDLLAGVGSNTVVTAASMKSRVQNKNKIKEGVDGTAALMFYIEEMNHFAGMAVPINHINKLLLNPTMAKTIEANYGKDILEALRMSIQRVANKGRINKGARFVNFVNTAFIMSRLGLNPVVMLKQLTSFVTYANDIGFVNWLRYAATNITQMRKVFKEIKANSVYMDDRAYNNIMKAIETYAPEKVQKFLPAPILNSLMNIAMWTTKFGDKAAIYIGGMPNYSYHKAEFKKKNPGATEQQAIDYAIRKFEKDTKNTQQSADIQNKDLFQTGDPYMRFLNMFMTTPKQYNRRVFGSIGNLIKIVKSGGKEGKGTLISNLRTIGTYHFVMPMFFQWVALGFPLGADWDEEDEEDMKRAAYIGNMNSLFIAGDVITMIADAIQGKPWAFNVGAMPALTIPKNIGLYIDKAAKAKTPETREKWTRKAMYEGMSFFGIPASNIDKIYNNFIKLSEGGLTEKEAILRALQYSDYVIEGKKDKKKSKTKKPTKKEMKEYFPEQYQRELEMEEMIKEMTYDPEVEALEAEIKAMEDEARREMLEAMRE